MLYLLHTSNMFHVMSNVFERNPCLLMIFLSVPPYIPMINIPWFDKVFFSMILFFFLNNWAIQVFTCWKWVSKQVQQVKCNFLSNTNSKQVWAHLLMVPNRGKKCKLLMYLIYWNTIYLCLKLNEFQWRTCDAMD